MILFFEVFGHLLEVLPIKTSEGLITVLTFNILDMSQLIA